MELIRTTTASAATAAVADDDLVQRLAAHDAAAEQALAILYDRYSAAVYGTGLRLLGDAGQAENLLQETFWRLWQHAGRYEPGRVRFATWLLRIATNYAISDLRRAARRPRTTSWTVDLVDGDGTVREGVREPADPDGDVADLVWQTEQRRLLAAGLRTLPPQQRQAVELAYFGQLSHSKIAAVQGAPLSTVKTRLQLGLQKLSAFLAAHGVTASLGTASAAA
jgi:RNA polymerase sigma-70 factor (ECF subfamily)